MDTKRVGIGPPFFVLKGYCHQKNGKRVLKLSLVLTGV